MRGYAWPATAIILGGILHTVFLLSQTREDVFYASDARVKSLLVRQFDRGRLTPVLRLSDEAWVRELWDRNLTAKNNLNVLLGQPMEKRNVIQRMFPPDRL